MNKELNRPVWAPDIEVDMRGLWNQARVGQYTPYLAREFAQLEFQSRHFACKACGAGAGQRCSTPAGNPRANSHIHRGLLTRAPDTSVRISTSEGRRNE